MKRERIIGVVCLILGILIALAPIYLVPVCGPMEDGSFMRCHWTGNAISAMGYVMAVLSVLFIFIKNTYVSLGIAMANVIVGIYVIALPLKVIGMCGSAMMQCNTLTKPTVILLTCAYLVANIIYIFISKDKLKGVNDVSAASI